MDLVFASRQSDSDPTCEKPTAISPSGITKAEGLALLSRRLHDKKTRGNRHNIKITTFFILRSSKQYPSFTNIYSTFWRKPQLPALPYNRILPKLCSLNRYNKGSGGHYGVENEDEIGA